MRNNVRVSVIMPVYNVEGYVRRAVQSMLAQDFADLELICVDDGSRDASGRILDEMAAQDDRMRVIHQKNGGAPAARNAAMAVAQGEYFYFCDADDWAEPNMLSRMVQRADETQAEYVITGYYVDTYSDDEHFVTTHVHRPDALLEQADFRRVAYDYFDCNLLYAPWNKLFRADVLRQKNIRFRDVKMDDFPFNLDYMREVGRVAVMDEAFYHFTRARAESETQKYYSELFAKREEEHGWMIELFGFWQVKSDPAREFLARRYIERLIGCFENVTCKACPLTGREKRAAIRKMMESPNVAWSLQYARPRSVMMRLMLLPVRVRCTWWAYIQSCFISFVRKNFFTVFARLKASR